MACGSAGEVARERSKLHSPQTGRGRSEPVRPMVVPVLAARGSSTCAPSPICSFTADEKERRLTPQVRILVAPANCGFRWIGATCSPSGFEQPSLLFLLCETSWRWGRTVGGRHTMWWWVTKLVVERIFPFSLVAASRSGQRKICFA